MLEGPSSKWDHPWYMAGTEQSGEYHVIACGIRGRVGFRMLYSGGVRVRVEPTPGKHQARFVAKMKKALEGWTAPTPDNVRFSTVTSGQSAVDAVRLALRQIHGKKKVDRNPDHKVASWGRTILGLPQDDEAAA